MYNACDVSPWAQPLQTEKKRKRESPASQKESHCYVEMVRQLPWDILWANSLSSSFMKTLSNSAVAWFWKNGRPYVADLSLHSVLAPPAIASSGWNARNVAWTSKTTTRLELAPIQEPTPPVNHYSRAMETHAQHKPGVAEKWLCFKSRTAKSG